MPSTFRSGSVIPRESDRRVCGSIGPTGARKYRQALRRRGIRMICPERKDARKARLAKGARGGRPPACDTQAYKGRNVVERGINRLKDFRAVCTRFDKRGHNYHAGVLIACIMLWL